MIPAFTILAAIAALFTACACRLASDADQRVTQDERERARSISLGGAADLIHREGK